MSQFYDQASLVMVPSGYKAGKVYSQKPLSTDGELTFTRNSNATRVNADGLVEKVRTNVALYSEDLTNAAWPKNRSSITANALANPVNGATTADYIVEDTANGTHEAIQIFTVTSGISYTISVYAKADTRTKIAIVLAGSAFASGGNGQAIFNLSTGAVISAINGAIARISDAGNGWYHCSITKASIDTSGVIALELVDASNNTSYTGDGTSRAAFFGAQLEVSDFGPTDYIATTSAAVSVGPTANVPRLDYSGGCPALKLEPQRSNLALWSEQFNNWSLGGGTITNNAAISPDGYQNADEFSGGIYCYQVGSYGVCTFSVYRKYTTEQLTALRLDISTGPNYIEYDLVNGAVTSIPSGFTASIESVGNGWYRCIATATQSVSLALISGASYTWGAQIEAGSYATSYIPTLGASVTRLVDGLGTLNMATLCPTSNYSIFFEIDDSNLTDPSTWLFLASSSGSGDPFQIYASTAIINTASGYIYPFSYVPSSNASGKVCLTYNGTTVKVFKDGVLVGQYTANANWANKTTLNFTHNPTQKNNIKQILLFPSVLTEAQAIELTTV